MGLAKTNFGFWVGVGDEALAPVLQQPRQPGHLQIGALRRLYGFRWPEHADLARKNLAAKFERLNADAVAVEQQPSQPVLHPGAFRIPIEPKQEVVLKHIGQIVTCSTYARRLSSACDQSPASVCSSYFTTRAGGQSFASNRSAAESTCLVPFPSVKSSTRWTWGEIKLSSRRASSGTTSTR